MPRPRGRAHTSLTETATTVVNLLIRQAGVKMIAPGIIDARRFGPRHITVVYTNGGFELIISGQGVQKVAVHLVEPASAVGLVSVLKKSKALQHFQWNERERKPGI